MTEGARAGRENLDMKLESIHTVCHLPISVRNRMVAIVWFLGSLTNADLANNTLMENSYSFTIWALDR